MIDGRGQTMVDLFDRLHVSSASGQVKVSQRFERCISSILKGMIVIVVVSCFMSLALRMLGEASVLSRHSSLLYESVELIIMLAG